MENAFIMLKNVSNSLPFPSNLPLLFSDLEQPNQNSTSASGARRIKEKKERQSKICLRKKLQYPSNAFPLQDLPLILCFGFLP